MGSNPLLGTCLLGNYAVTSANSAVQAGNGNESVIQLPSSSQASAEAEAQGKVETNQPNFQEDIKAALENLDLSPILKNGEVQATFSTNESSLSISNGHNQTQIVGTGYITIPVSFVVKNDIQDNDDLAKGQESSSSKQSKSETQRVIKQDQESVAKGAATSELNGSGSLGTNKQDQSSEDARKKVELQTSAEGKASQAGKLQAQGSTSLELNKKDQSSEDVLKQAELQATAEGKTSYAGKPQSQVSAGTPASSALTSSQAQGSTSLELNKKDQSSEDAKKKVELQTSTEGKTSHAGKPKELLADAESKASRTGKQESHFKTGAEATVAPINAQALGLASLEVNEQTQESASLEQNKQVQVLTSSGVNAQDLTQMGAQNGVGLQDVSKSNEAGKLNGQVSLSTGSTSAAMNPHGQGSFSGFDGLGSAGIITQSQTGMATDQIAQSQGQVIGGIFGAPVNFLGSRSAELGTLGMGTQAQSESGAQAGSGLLAAGFNGALPLPLQITESGMQVSQNESSYSSNSTSTQEHMVSGGEFSSVPLELTPVSFTPFATGQVEADAGFGFGA
ncbi:uncharacterized protein [Halyomorpha halys]|uniref:uncharacterized protein n=1 Tax=Halyomorpha halys TaxID=286706 RepID=UPI0034D17483